MSTSVVSRQERGQVLTGRPSLRSTTAVARGDLSKTIDVDAQGEILQLKDTVNDMVRSLNSFSSEVSRCASDAALSSLITS